MSRPFSYNDANFTVIGTVLICHIMLNKKIPSGEPIIEIPPAIVNHMFFYTNAGYMVTDRFDNTSAYGCFIGVKNIDDKYYFISNASMDNVNYKCLFTTYFLKDI